MLGLKTLLEARQPGKVVEMTVDGMIARAENRAMVELIPIPLVPINQVVLGPEDAVVMVDSQPGTGRRASEAVTPVVVLDHHETGGNLDGVHFTDVRANLGATKHDGHGLSPRAANQRLLEARDGLALRDRLGGLGYPRESGPLDDGALVWLYPRADKDLLARIKNPKLSQDYFATFQHALANAFLYRDVVVSWCGPVPQPDIIAEVADFFIRFDRVNWSLSIGRFENLLKLSIRSAHLGGHSGEVSERSSTAEDGGRSRQEGRRRHPSARPSPETIDETLRLIRHRLLAKLEIDEQRWPSPASGQSIIQAP